MNPGHPKLIRNSRVIAASSTGESPTLVMPEGAIRLKGTGPEIIALCDGIRSIEEILSLLKTKYPNANPTQLETETMEFLNSLREKRVLDF